MSKSSDQHYTVEKIGEGVYAAIARPDGRGICNSGFVDLGGSGLVFDTSLTAASARDLRSQANESLGRAPSLAVNSHWHLDHSLGNSMFSNVPIWGTRRTREIILERRDELLSELTREKLEVGVRELEGRRAETRSPGAFADLEFNLRIYRALLDAVDELNLAPPDHTFETQTSLPGNRGAELLSFGAGHTEADAVLHLRREKILFAGDLVVVGIQPSMGSGNPEGWLSGLDQIERLGAERIVPGHGPVTDVEGIRETRGYVSGVLSAAQSTTGARPPPSIRRWEGSVSLEENLKFTRGWVAALRPPK